MHTLQQIESAFVAWAQDSDDIRAAFVVGSQARTDHPADEWSDLDIILFAHHVERYYEATDWIAALVPVWLTMSGRTAAGDPERMVLFAGGLKVDWVFHPGDVLLQVPQMLASGDIPDIIRRGTRVLLDKEGTLAQMPPPGPLLAQQPPDAKTFREALDAFWFSAASCAKQLRRGELWSFQNGSTPMLGRLLQMVEWHARAGHSWDYDTWHGGKFLAEWAGDETYGELQQVFARLDEMDAWRALQARLKLYHRLARAVAARLGLDYPTELEAQIGTYIEEVGQDAPK